MKIKSLILFLSFFNLLNTYAYNNLSDGGHKGSWANKIMAHGSDQSIEEEDPLGIGSGSYDPSHIYNDWSRSVQRRNFMSISKTAEALVQLNQNLYGFYLDREDVWDSSMYSSSGIYGTKYDCEDDRDNVGNRFCEFIEFLEYTKNQDIKVVLINPKYQSGGADRWFNSTDYVTTDIRNWASSLEDMAIDIGELSAIYPNLVGFSVDDFDSKICSFEKANSTDNGYDNCITKEEVENIYDLAQNNGVSFYPVIYTERSNHLLNDAIVLGKSRNSYMYSGESIKVEVPLLYQNRSSRSGIQYCTPYIKGFTSDSRVTDANDVDAYEGITKKIYFEITDSIKGETSEIVVYEQGFLDPELYNDQLGTYITRKQIPVSNTTSIKLVFKLETTENLRYAINALWSISNLEVSCNGLKFIPAIRSAKGYVQGASSSSWTQVGDSSLSSLQQKFIGGNTVNYHTASGSTSEYDFAGILNQGYQLVWELYNYESDYTERWGDATEFEEYFRKLLETYQQNSDNNMILTMYGINNQLHRVDEETVMTLKETIAKVITELQGNFWYYKGGLELYYLNDADGIGYMSFIEHDSHASFSNYDNTIWIPISSTKYPYYYACFDYEVSAGGDYTIDYDLTNIRATSEIKPIILVDGVEETSFSILNSEHTIYPSSDSTLSVCLVDDATIDSNGNQDVANRSNYSGFYFSIFDNSDGNYVAPLDEQSFFAGFTDEDTDDWVYKMWESINSTFNY